MTRQQLFPHLIFDSVFDDFIRTIPVTQRVPSSGFPVVDHYYDDEGNAILEFALAGYKAEDLKVAVEGSKLTVSSEGVKEPQAVGSIRRIAKRKFLNTYTDHENAFDLQGLSVSFEDGILKIEIPKKETAKAKVFEIITPKKTLTA